MKNIKKVLGFIILASIILLPINNVLAAANDIIVDQIGPSGSGTPSRSIFIATTSSGVLGWDNSTMLPVGMNFGPGLSYSGGSIIISGISSSSITGLSSLLDSMTATLISMQSQVNGKAATSSIPTALSQLTNDMGFSTTSAPVSSVAGKIGVVTLVKGDVGLSNLDNTSDANKPISTAAQTAFNAKYTTPAGTTAQYIRGDGTLATSPSLGISYEGTTQRLISFPVFKSATVASNVAVFNLTSDGTSGGTALFPNGVIQDSVGAIVNDALASYQMSWIFSNSNKTLTVTANKLGTANLVSGILGQIAANGAVIKLTIWGY